MARGPADQIRPQIKEHEDSLGTSWRYLEATLGAEAAPSSWPERRRWRDEAPTPPCAHPTRLAPAIVICWYAAHQRRGVEAGPRAWGTRQLDRPERPSDTSEVRRVGDLLVSQEFGPRAVGRLREIVDGSFPETVPPGGRLSRRFPEKWKSRICVAKDDHVAAPTPAREAASWRTFSMSGDAGSHSVPRTCRGERPSNCARSRSNQRRAPNSL